MTNPTTQTEPGDIVERLRSVTEDDAYAHPWTFGQNCHEAADTITNLRTEHQTAMSEMAKLLVENEHLRELVNVANYRADNLHADLEMFYSENSYVVGANDGWDEAIEQAAVVIEQADGAIPNRQELAASVRSLANTGKEDRG